MDEMTEIYGTIGPACARPELLRAMFDEGMTGMRLNTSHVSLHEAAGQVAMIHEAAAACGVQAKLLIDLQGPELRIGRLAAPMQLEEGAQTVFCEQGGSGIPVPGNVLEALEPGMQALLDDGRILLEVTGEHTARVLRGGTLLGSKSIALPGADLEMPALTAQDRENISVAAAFGVTGVMQPFVRSADDLMQVRMALDAAGGADIALLAKIESMAGVAHLTDFFGLADEIVIARGDLGNAMPLWELPRVQKTISAKCRAAGVPFMVVTQMLASMVHSAVPTRAEVSDIYNAVCDGAASVMVTGETAAGDHPVEVIRYLARTVRSAEEVLTGK